LPWVVFSSRFSSPIPFVIAANYRHNDLIYRYTGNVLLGIYVNVKENNVIRKALGISLSGFFNDEIKDLPPVILLLVEIAKKLTPQERRKLIELLRTFSERMET
jgi:hypothetical protein